MSTLASLSQDLTSLVSRLGPSLVRVDGRGGRPGTGFSLGDGLVITAHHGLDREEGLEVTGADGKTATARLVGADAGSDLALLELAAPAPAWPAAPLADGDPAVGQLVLALSRPGRTVRAALGVISAVGDSWRTYGGSRIDRYVETDIGLYPGFSGSPLVDASGQVVGLGTSGLVRGTAVVVPAATLRRTVDSLRQGGKVKRGYLGITSHPVRLPAALAQGLGQPAGLLISSVQPGSAADGAGLLLGDVLVALGGQPVRNLGELFEQLEADRIGKPTPVKLIRGGQLQDLDITVAERP